MYSSMCRAGNATQGSNTYTTQSIIVCHCSFAFEEFNALAFNNEELNEAHTVLSASTELWQVVIKLQRGDRLMLYGPAQLW